MVFRFILINDSVYLFDSESKKYLLYATLPMKRMRVAADFHIEFQRNANSLSVSIPGKLETIFAGPVFEFNLDTGVATYPITGEEELKCVAHYLSYELGDQITFSVEMDSSILRTHEVHLSTSDCNIKARTGFDVCRIIADVKSDYLRHSNLP